jgi:hypothetical protein
MGKKVLIYKSIFDPKLTNGMQSRFKLVSGVPHTLTLSHPHILETNEHVDMLK